MVSRKCPVRVSISDGLADTALENLGHELIVADDRVNVGLDPLALFDFPPAYFVASIDDDVVEQDPLRPSVPLTERMDHVQIAIKLGDGTSKLLPCHALIPVGFSQSPEKLRRLGLDSSHVAKVSSAFGYIDCPKLSGPFVDVYEQGAMDTL